MTTVFGTRSLEGVTLEHKTLEESLEAFMASDGYRIDFNLSDGRVLFIHRAEYGDDISQEKLDHPAWRDYKQAVSKVLVYDPQNLHNNNDNVTYVDFSS
jgi:hypothetical protein